MTLEEASDRIPSMAGMEVPRAIGSYPTMAGANDQQGDPGHLAQSLREIYSHFLNPDEALFKHLGVVAVILGGSLVYQRAIIGTVSSARL